MTFTLTIDMDNAEFQEDGAEGRSALATLLGTVTRDVEHGDLDRCPVFDSNGNRVGAWEIK